MQLRLADVRLSAPERGDDTLSATLADIARMGFDGVVCGDAGSAADAARLVAAARSNELTTWLAVVPDADGEPEFDVVGAHRAPPWLVVDDAALDPRAQPGGRRRNAVEMDEARTARWHAALGERLAAGIAGLVCREPDRLPLPFWSTTFDTLASAHPDARWFAWTAGLSPHATAAFVDAGFGGVTSSVAWWDASSGWLSDEARRQSGTTQLAFPIDPFDPDERERRLPQRSDARARLWAAAMVGDVIVVPAPWLALEPVREIVAAIARWQGDAGATSLLSGPGSPITALARADAADLRIASRVHVALINHDADAPASIAASTLVARLGGFKADAGSAVTLAPGSTVRLAAGECVVVELVREPMVAFAPIGTAVDALRWPRVAIEAVTPAVEDGRFPVKRIVGEAVRVEADIVIDGHEKLAAALLYRAVGDAAWREAPMEHFDNDRHAATFPLERVGRHEFTIEAWRDVFASYRYELDKKFAAGLDVSLELAEGRLLVAESEAAARAAGRADVAARLAELARSLAVADTARVPKIDRATMATQVAALLASSTRDDMRAADPRAFVTRPDPVYTVDAERPEAAFASWYELFPRSQGNVPGEPLRHGTFADVVDRLPAVRAMGFDVLYFTPIHPIGRKNRKGRNNSLTPGADDPGSPYAIGAADGGHDALHPELGTFDDFRRLRDAAMDQGLELALDFAIQCSPDHHWLQEHPGWFAWRPDGSLRYAENPPKKYEDIVNVDFYAHGDTTDAEASELWIALRDVVLLWVDAGVKIFRVDNPHTKSLPFWEWMIGEVRARHPDTIFLSEAFTRPKVMYRLAKVGFSQSYTYFTWRHTKQEFTDYLTELVETAPRDFFRPNFFVNTPDINPYFLQRSGRQGFLIRAALAATLSGVWGIYSGFELCEATPVPGKEEYLDSEKYEIRAWDWRRPGHIIDEITRLNRVRRENPALQTHLNVRFETVFDPNILYFYKATEDRSNVVLVAINLDPHGVHEADFEVPLWRLGLPDDATVRVTDLVDDRSFAWHGKYQRMRLDPLSNPYAIWRLAA